MIIGGLTKCSLIDFPGKVSSVIFTQGCNFRCTYCHNPELVYPSLYTVPISNEQVIQFLERRAPILDGVVISGGEPTLQKDLLPFLIRIKAMGYLVKLDTNGSQPQVLRELLSSGVIDYIAMDIKSSFDNYTKVCSVNVNCQNIKKSIRMIEESRISYQFRTTYDTELLDINDLKEIRSFLKRPNSLFVQKCIKRKSETGGSKIQGEYSGY